MALTEYIEVSDITHVHLKQFASASGVLEAYVSEANDQYEDLGLQLGVDPSDLYTPIPIVSKRYLNSYIVSRFAEDSIATNNVEVSDDDMYVRMANEFEKNLTQYRKQLTPELIMGVSSNSRSARSISTGKLYRTA